MHSAVSNSYPVFRDFFLRARENLSLTKKVFESFRFCLDSLNSDKWTFKTFPKSLFRRWDVWTLLPRFLCIVLLHQLPLKYVSYSLMVRRKFLVKFSVLFETDKQKLVGKCRVWNALNISECVLFIKTIRNWETSLSSATCNFHLI